MNWIVITRTIVSLAIALALGFFVKAQFELSAGAGFISFVIFAGLLLLATWKLFPADAYGRQSGITEVLKE